MTAAKITDKTSITVALAVSLMAGAFYSGVFMAEMRQRVHTVETRQDDADVKRESMEQILSELRDLTKDHDRQLRGANR